jgi:LacI family transcriptional regulator
MTIKDIARKSGYAVGTVSRALNGHPSVSPEARAKILAVVQENNFTPNSNAKHLKQQANSGIAIIVKGARNMLFAGILELLQTEIRQHGYAVFVNYLGEDDNEVLHARRICRERKPLGILFLGSCLSFFEEDFRGIEIPCVLITNSAADLGFSNLASVSTDDALAAETCIRYLAEQGHRKIGILGGVLGGADPSSIRLAGCLKGFSACGIPFDQARQYQAARFSMESGYAAMEQLLISAPDTTAVFAFSDAMAIGALRALRDHGRRVPEDISLVGYDGIELSRYSIPRLATVRQEDHALARRGVSLLLAQIEDGAPAAYETVPFSLMEGETVKELEKK